MSTTTMWKCEVCGYVHTGPEPPETCPVCGVGRELFSPLVVETGEVAPAAAAERWRCTLCDHVHEGAAPPETCPVCGAPAALFEPVAVREVAPAAEAVGTVVIIGAGVAGFAAAEAARRTAPGARIRLLSKEPGRPYLRLNLTRFLAGEVTEADLAMQGKAWFRDERIELEQAEATAVDPEAREVRLRGGEVVAYDRLVLAGGAHPFVPPILGVTREGVHTFRTLADAKAIVARARAGARCVCIGGGLLGLETAGALQRLGLQVTVAEGFRYLLPRQLPEAAAQLLEAHLTRLGITVRCGVQVKAVGGDEAAAAVVLEGEESLPAELVVISAGVRPNSYLARQCGLTVERGVVVDDRMATSAPGIYAAGDLCEHRGEVFGIWPTAHAQGVVAGTNAAGGRATLPAMARSNRLKVLDVDVFSIGKVAPEDGSYRVYHREGQGTCEHLVVRDGRLLGAALYGDTRLAGDVKEAVESGRQIQQTSLSGIINDFQLASA